MLVLFATLTLLACFVIVLQPSAASDKGIYRAPPPLVIPERKMQLTRAEAETQLLSLSARFSQLITVLNQRTQQHLQFAKTYDLDAFKKNDDEISSLHELIDATLLDMQILSDYLGKPPSYLEQARANIQKSKLFMYKSSSVLYLCFGRPVQAQQCARLGMLLADLHPSLRESVNDISFYLGAASCWAGDYKVSEKQLKETMNNGSNKPHTQVAPGTTVNVAGQNPFTPHYLGTVYIAEKQNGKALEVLHAARQTAPSDEMRGHADALLALAHSLDRNSNLAREHIRLAESELGAGKAKVFPAVAQESLGIVAALSGDYQAAERRLSQAMPGLQASPLDLGNRLEAAQAALWRSYCREKLGNAEGSQEDRKYAMSFADEAPHLVTIAQILDSLFNRKLTSSSEEPVRNKWAIIVGVSQFADPTVPRLSYSAKDAQDITRFLVQTAGFPPDHVKTLLNAGATKANLKDCLAGSWLPEVSRPGDLVFLFISSHGTPAYKDIGALNSVVTYDTRLDQLFSTSLPMPSIVRMTRNKLEKRYVFVILDTCYAGGLGAPGEEARSSANVDPALLLSSNYQLLASSSDSHERSWESKRYPNGIFTRQFINAIVKNPSYEDFRSVFATIKERVSKEVTADYAGNTQTPMLSGRWSGKQLADNK